MSSPLSILSSSAASAQQNRERCKEHYDYKKNILNSFDGSRIYLLGETKYTAAKATKRGLRMISLLLNRETDKDKYVLIQTDLPERTVDQRTEKYQSVTGQQMRTIMAKDAKVKNLVRLDHYLKYSEMSAATAGANEEQEAARREAYLTEHTTAKGRAKVFSRLASARLRDRCRAAAAAAAASDSEIRGAKDFSSVTTGSFGSLTPSSMDNTGADTKEMDGGFADTSVCWDTDFGGEGYLWGEERLEDFLSQLDSFTTDQDVF